ncbi:MAG: type Z 30S ribosomal protein S14 [Vampirovibrio sp.]|jgi:small subunit ribosomal protein S14
MAKVSMVTKEAQREIKVAKGKYPKTRLQNRCSICGRPRSYYRQFGICRVCLRKMAHEGKLPGVTKSSW